MKFPNSSKLKPYPSYRPSGVDWLGQVPAHWEVSRGKALLASVDVRSETGDEDLLTVSAQHGIIPRKSANVTMFKAESYVGYKLCWPGDLVINSLWAWAHGLGVSRYYGIVSSVYGVYRPLPRVHAQYIHLLTRSIPFQWELQVRSKGIWVSRLQLTDEAFLGAPFPLPPLDEQSAIARFLDHADHRIRRYIRAKERLIELLEEQKQAIIHQAVTGKIDVRTGKPYPTYKNSGVEWLGKVPEYWEVISLKRVFVSMEYGISDSGSDSGSIGLLTMGNVRNGEITVPRCGGVSSVDSRLLLQDKDLLFNRTNSSELVAKVGLFRSEGRPVTFASYLVRLRTSPENSPEFLNLLLNDVGFLAIARREAIPSLHQSNLNPTRYGRLKIPLPPPSEQECIIRHINSATDDMKITLAHNRCLIELFREYRTRLIADVVTGKLDVREAAVSLPDQVNAPEPPEAVGKP